MNSSSSALAYGVGSKVFPDLIDLALFLHWLPFLMQTYFLSGLNWD